MNLFRVGWVLQNGGKLRRKAWGKDNYAWVQGDKLLRDSGDGLGITDLLAEDWEEFEYQPKSEFEKGIAGTK